jgi:hypothetical protein
MAFLRSLSISSSLMLSLSLVAFNSSITRELLYMSFIPSLVCSAAFPARSLMTMLVWVIPSPFLDAISARIPSAVTSSFLCPAASPVPKSSPSYLVNEVLPPPAGNLLLGPTT